MRAWFVALTAAVVVGAGSVGYGLVTADIEQREAREHTYRTFVGKTVQAVGSYIQSASADPQATPPSFLHATMPSRFTMLDPPSRPVRVGDAEIVLMPAVSKDLCQAIGRGPLPGSTAVSVNGGATSPVADASRCQDDIWTRSTPIYQNNLIVVLAKSGQGGTPVR